jgi:excisionase family DNA binding protein
MTICNSNTSIEPFVVPPKTAWRLLNVSNTTGYALLAANELQYIKVGRATRITMESIRDFIIRKAVGTE